MKYFDWNPLKSTKLQVERGSCFEDIVAAIDGDKLLDTIPHPSQQHYPLGQQLAKKKTAPVMVLFSWLELRNDYRIFVSAGEGKSQKMSEG